MLSQKQTFLSFLEPAGGGYLWTCHRKDWSRREEQRLQTRRIKGEKLNLRTGLLKKDKPGTDGGGVGCGVETKRSKQCKCKRFMVQ